MATSVFGDACTVVYKLGGVRLLAKAQRGSSRRISEVTTPPRRPTASLPSGVSRALSSQVKGSSDEFVNAVDHIETHPKVIADMTS